MEIYMYDDSNASFSNVELSKTYLSGGQETTLSFRLTAKTKAITHLSFRYREDNGSYINFYENTTVGISKGKYKDFEIAFTVDEANFIENYSKADIYVNVGDSSVSNLGYIDNAFTFIRNRVAPVPIQYTFLDSSGEIAWRPVGPLPNATVGDHNLKIGFVEDYSQIYFYGNAELDSQDPTLSCKHHVTIYADNTKTNILYDGDTVVPFSSVPGITVFPGNVGLEKATIGKISTPGIYPCECYTKDSAGLISETIYGNLEVRKYDIPTFNQFYGERLHVTYDTDGSILEVVPSLAGELKILNFDFEVQQLYVKKDSGHNAGLVYGEQTTTGELVEYTNTFSLTVSYTGSDGSTGSVVVQVSAVIENDKYKINFSDEPKNLFPDAVFSDAEDYTFTATVADKFTTVSYNTYINKVTGIFDIEKNGVAVGMLSTSTDEEKKFEVHEDYNTYLYGNADISKDLNVIGGLTVHGGISGVTNYPDIFEFPTVEGTNVKYGVEELTGGRWIDGRPIYKFTWMGTTKLAGQQGTVAYFPGKIVPETVIRIGGTWRRDYSDNAWFSIPNIYYGSIEWAVNIRTTEDGGVLLGFGDKYSGNKTVVIFVEYTKSTDQPYTRLDIATLNSTILK